MHELFERAAILRAFSSSTLSHTDSQAQAHSSEFLFPVRQSSCKAGKRLYFEVVVPVLSRWESKVRSWPTTAATRLPRPS